MQKTTNTNNNTARGFLKKRKSYAHLSFAECMDELAKSITALNELLKQNQQPWGKHE